MGVGWSPDQACGGSGGTFRLDLGLLARRQREDEVDPAGPEVRGRGEGPDPAARFTWPWTGLTGRCAVTGSCAHACNDPLASAGGRLTIRLPDASRVSLGATKNTSLLRASVAEALRQALDHDRNASSSFCRTSQPLPTCLHKGEKALDFEGPVQPSAARLSERLAKAGLDVLTTGVWLLGRLRGTRCWPALGLQRRAPEPPVWTAEASTWPSLAPRPCGTTLLSPAKELGSGRATLRSFASHKRRKAVAQDQKEAPSSACSRQDTFATQHPKKISV